LLLLSSPSHSYKLDWITDGGLVGMSAGFLLFSQMLIRSGALSPQAPEDPDLLPDLDRHFAQEDTARNWHRHLSDAGAGFALSYALLDGIFSGPEEATLYLESALLNLSLANLVKLSARRPRPRSYLDGANTETDSALSFYSGHTALTAGLSATASYLAFQRSSRWRWYTLAGGLFLTALVGSQRVQAREHFPTDVFAGALMGSGIGLLLPHLHRSKEGRATLHASPSSLSLTGRF